MTEDQGNAEATRRMWPQGGAGHEVAELLMMDNWETGEPVLTSATLREDVWLPKGSRIVIAGRNRDRNPGPVDRFSFINVVPEAEPAHEPPPWAMDPGEGDWDGLGEGGEDPHQWLVSEPLQGDVVLPAGSAVQVRQEPQRSPDAWTLETPGSRFVEDQPAGPGRGWGEMAPEEQSASVSVQLGPQEAKAEAGHVAAAEPEAGSQADMSKMEGNPLTDEAWTEGRGGGIPEPPPPEEDDIPW